MAIRGINHTPFLGIGKEQAGEKDDDELVLVFDLGGGTFDISILELGDGVFEVKSTNGDVHLGGVDFDSRIIDWLAEEFLKDENIDLRKDPMALQRLKEAAEKAKIELSTVEKTTIHLPFITADKTGPKHIEKELTREVFEDLCKELINRCRIPVEKALNDAGGSLSDVIRTRIYVTNIKDWDAIGRAHGEFFRDIKPVTTMVEVKSLIEPNFVVELEATAYLKEE